jgi:hypothetical protein
MMISIISAKQIFTAMNGRNMAMFLPGYRPDVVFFFETGVKTRLLDHGVCAIFALAIRRFRKRFNVLQGTLFITFLLDSHLRIRDSFLRF